MSAVLLGVAIGLVAFAVSVCAVPLYVKLINWLYIRGGKP